MPFLEEITTKLGIAVMLKDNLTADKSVIGPVYLKAAVKIPPVKHPSGYYLLLNVPPGICRITASGKYYQDTYLEVNPATLNPKLPVVDMVLIPGANHP
jgi:hypothetical protein